MSGYVKINSDYISMYLYYVLTIYTWTSDWRIYKFNCLCFVHGKAWPHRRKNMTTKANYACMYFVQYTHTVKALIERQPLYSKIL